MIAPMAVVDLMTRPVYGMAEIDALCRIAPGTARRWIDGYTRANRTYPPIVRIEHTGEELVTWGEFVEVRLLAEYRDTGVPIQNLRPVVSRLRDELGVQHPLAVARQWLTPEGRQLVQRIQADEKLPKGLQLVREIATGQVALSTEVAHFVDTAELGEDALSPVIRVHPLGRDRPVVIDPMRRSGAPTVGAVPTDVILEQFVTGSFPSEIAQDFDLTEADVVAALQFEAGNAVDLRSA